MISLTRITLIVSFIVYLYSVVTATVTTTDAVDVVVGETTTEITCPPTNFDSLINFDFDSFIVDRWYSIQQLPVTFQPLSQFYCVYADYTKVTTKSWYCQIFQCEDPPSIKIFNSARSGSIYGSVGSITFGGTLTDSNTSTSKAKVTFPFIPIPLRSGSNYWVVAAGKFNNLASVTNSTPSHLKYDYAVITTGQPDTVGKNGCYSSGGMWMFSKVNILPDGALDDIKNIANDLGLSTDELRPVEQAGCEYIEFQSKLDSSTKFD